MFTLKTSLWYEQIIVGYLLIKALHISLMAVSVKLLFSPTIIKHTNKNLAFFDQGESLIIFVS